jgi:hypothetical protein
MIHKLTLVEERKGQPDLYRADDWEPYEVSSVSIPADISVGVGRAMEKKALRQDSADEQPIDDQTCTDCGESMDECDCGEPDETQDLEASRSKRANTTERKNMSDKNDNKPDTPVVETRTAAENTADEIFRWGERLNEPELARKFAASENPNVEEFRKAVREKDAATAQTEQRTGPDSGLVGFEKSGEVLVDRAKREIIDSIGQG